MRAVSWVSLVTSWELIEEGARRVRVVACRAVCKGVDCAMMMREGYKETVFLERLWVSGKCTPGFRFRLHLRHRQF